MFRHAQQRPSCTQQQQQTHLAPLAVTPPHAATLCKTKTSYITHPCSGIKMLRSAKNPRRLQLRATAEPREKTGSKPVKPGAPPAKGSPSPTPSPLPPKTKPSFLRKVVNQAVDSAEDVARHMNRLLLPLPTRTALDKMVRGGRGRYQLKTDKPVVLICGSGWGAHRYVMYACDSGHWFLYTCTTLLILTQHYQGH